MTAVQDVATTDEKTIIKVANNEVDLPKKKRKKGKRKNGSVETMKVHELLMAWLEEQQLKLTDERVKRISATEIIVRNPSVTGPTIVYDTEQ